MAAKVAMEAKVERIHLGVTAAVAVVPVVTQGMGETVPPGIPAPAFLALEEVVAAALAATKVAVAMATVAAAAVLASTAKAIVAKVAQDTMPTGSQVLVATGSSMEAEVLAARWASAD